MFFPNFVIWMLKNDAVLSSDVWVNSNAAQLAVLAASLLLANDAETFRELSTEIAWF